MAVRQAVLNFALVFLSAALLVLPFHFGAFWFLSYFAFLPYFFVMRRKTPWEAFKISYLFGALFFILLGYWLTLVNVLGFTLLVLYLSLYFGLFGFWGSYFLNSPRIKTSLLLPAIWVALEYFRGWVISGVPWSLLAYSQWKNIVCIQISDITGAYGVSFFILWVNVILLFAAEAVQEQKKSFKVYAGWLAAVFLGVVLYGFWSLAKADTFYARFGDRTRLRVSVVQGNIPQELKWDAKIKNIIFEKYRRLTLMSALDRSDLIVWPETSFPGYLEDELLLSAQLRGLVRQSRTDVLVGAPTLGDIEQGLRFYNSAILYGADGEEKMRYSKLHLVPFGEYVPFESVFGFIRHFFAIGHFSSGKEKTIFQIESRYQKTRILTRFAVLICYEDIFPGLVRDFCLRGADFLVNMTNDAWFGKTTAPYQHAQASVFRAVENRKPVVRATNTGLSCFISPEGRILDSVEDKGRELFVTGRRGHDLILGKRTSFYTRFGDVFILAVFALCFLAYRDQTKRSAYTRL